MRNLLRAETPKAFRLLALRSSVSSPGGGVKAILSNFPTYVAPNLSESLINSRKLLAIPLSWPVSTRGLIDPVRAAHEALTNAQGFEVKCGLFAA
jgi:hypothetical protein